MSGLGVDPRNVLDLSDHLVGVQLLQQQALSMIIKYKYLRFSQLLLLLTTHLFRYIIIISFQTVSHPLFSLWDSSY